MINISPNLDSSPSNFFVYKEVYFGADDGRNGNELWVYGSRISWTDCQAGEKIIANGTSTTNRQCSSCVFGSYTNATNQHRCINWTTCQAGEKIIADPTSSTDRQCSNCSFGSYTNAINQPSCTDWTNCQLVKKLLQVEVLQQIVNAVHVQMAIQPPQPASCTVCGCKAGEKPIAVNSTDRRCSTCTDGLRRRQTSRVVRLSLLAKLVKKLVSAATRNDRECRIYVDGYSVTTNQQIVHSKTCKL